MPSFLSPVFFQPRSAWENITSLSTWASSPGTRQITFCHIFWPASRRPCAVSLPSGAAWWKTAVRNGHGPGLPFHFWLCLVLCKSVVSPVITGFTITFHSFSITSFGKGFHSQSSLA